MEKYYTPYEAVVPLLPFLLPQTKFIEPCAGDGRLVRHLERNDHHCIAMYDIAPEHPMVFQQDVLFWDWSCPPCDMIITNPPWEREPLHKMIDKFKNIAPTWLLFDADWMHTKQAAPYLKYCDMIISIGRVSWEGNGKAGMDNSCWYRMQKNTCDTIFVGAQI